MVAGQWHWTYSCQPMGNGFMKEADTKDVTNKDDKTKIFVSPKYLSYQNICLTKIFVLPKYLSIPKYLSYQNVFNLNKNLCWICVHCCHKFGVLPFHLSIVTYEIWIQLDRMNNKFQNKNLIGCSHFSKVSFHGRRKTGARSSESACF